MTQHTEEVKAAEKVTGTNVVVLKDGRQVDFGKRGKLKKAIEIIGEGADRLIKIAVDVVNGDTHFLEIGVNHPLFWELAAHGASQKITDAVTKAEEEDDISFGVQAQIEQINKGIWSQRSAGETLFRGFAELFEAIRRIKGFEIGSDDANELKTSLAAASEEKIKNFRANNQIKVIIADIQAEKAAARAAKLSAAVAVDEFDLDF